MSRTLIMLMVGIGIGCGAPAPSRAAAAQCRAAAPLAVRVRFAEGAPREMLLEATAQGGLRLLDQATARQVWSAGSGTGNTQQIAGMNAVFGASLVAVHLDADGLHDRVYAGDQAGRLWRLELRSGALPSAWMHATLLADLGAPGGGRGFVAAPDITHIETADGSQWLNIAIGTANTGVPRSDHRFYVLRDAIGAADPAAPLTESDLVPLSPPLGLANGKARGYYLQLGAAQVLAQSLTLEGRIHFTVVESARALVAECAIGTLPTALVSMSVTILRATDGAVATDSNADGSIDQQDLRRSLAREMPASAAVELAASQGPAEGRIPCQVDAEPLPGCALDTRPRRSWWRREDAD